jgi:hypothetical protein
LSLIKPRSPGRRSGTVDEEAERLEESVALSVVLGLRLRALVELMAVGRVSPRPLELHHPGRNADIAAVDECT